MKIIAHVYASQRLISSRKESNLERSKLPKLGSHSFESGHNPDITRPGTVEHGCMIFSYEPEDYDPQEGILQVHAHLPDGRPEATIRSLRLIGFRFDEATCFDRYHLRVL
ncbi:MAG: hypothetical protein AAB381_00840 [Patescibacteria group bacterium]